MINAHLSDKDLNEIVDVPAPERKKLAAYGHIAICTLCQRRLEDLELIDQSLRQISYGTVDEHAVNRVMEQVRKRNTDSVAAVLVVQFVYILGLVIVLGIVGVVFYQFDIPHAPQFHVPSAEATGTMWEFYQRIQHILSSYAAPFSSIYESIRRSESYPILTFTILLLVFLAAVDRFLLQPMLWRRG